MPAAAGEESMGRPSFGGVQPAKLRRGLWSPEEDEKLYNHIIRHGVDCWSSVPRLAGLHRRGKSCRLRWFNYLRPDLKRGSFSQQEEDLIVALHEIVGNRWSQIASHLPGRTDNKIKNFWYSCITKKLRQQGIDPATHKHMAANRATAATAAAALPDAEEEDRNPRAAAADVLAPKQPEVFDPFPVCADYGGWFANDLGTANAAALYGQFGGSKEGTEEDSGFGAAYSSVLGVSENLGYGESSSNSSSWIYGGEVLHWAKAEPTFAEMERQHGGYGGEDDAPPEHKFSLPCQEQSLFPNFEFNLEVDF